MMFVELADLRPDRGHDRPPQLPKTLWSWFRAESCSAAKTTQPRLIFLLGLLECEVEGREVCTQSWYPPPPKNPRAPPGRDQSGLQSAEGFIGDRQLDTSFQCDRVCVLRIYQGRTDRCGIWHLRRGKNCVGYMSDADGSRPRQGNCRGFGAGMADAIMATNEAGSKLPTFCVDALLLPRQPCLVRQLLTAFDFRAQNPHLTLQLVGS